MKSKITFCKWRSTKSETKAVCDCPRHSKKARSTKANSRCDVGALFLRKESLCRAKRETSFTIEKLISSAAYKVLLAESHDFLKEFSLRVATEFFIEQYSIDGYFYRFRKVTILRLSEHVEGVKSKQNRKYVLHECA